MSYKVATIVLAVVVVVLFAAIMFLIFKPNKHVTGGGWSIPTNIDEAKKLAAETISEKFGINVTPELIDKMIDKYVEINNINTINAMTIINMLTDAKMIYDEVMNT